MIPITPQTPHFDQTRRLNIAYITSCRELGLDEHVGEVVVDPVNGQNYGYREGNLENLARMLRNENSDFSRRFNLTAVIVDDDDTQYARAWQHGQHGIWPRDLRVRHRNNDGTTSQPTLDDLTVRVPSQPWKNLRRDAIAGETPEAFSERKASAKAAYEQRILDVLRSREVDLVVSDSYTTIIGPTLLDAYTGRILNIHPAVTQVGDPDRLPGLTPTRDAYTRAVHGYIIIDDKRAVDHPMGEVVEVQYEGNPRTAVRVQPSSVTGVTVHVVTDHVDNGPIVRCHKYRFPTEGITPEAIRTNNYRIKRQILPEAMLDYTTQREQARTAQETRP